MWHGVMVNYVGWITVIHSAYSGVTVHHEYLQSTCISFWKTVLVLSDKTLHMQAHQQNLMSIARHCKALQGIAKIYIFHFHKIWLWFLNTLARQPWNFAIIVKFASLVYCKRLAKFLKALQGLSMPCHSARACNSIKILAIHIQKKN